MNSRLYPQPSAPPPPPPPSYQEVTNNIRQADPTSSYSTQNASVSQDSYMNNL
ncbi:unnamed protein product, partial [Rotaria socialis]